MPNLVERLALLSFAGFVACTGGQGGDPGQTVTGGSGGMGPGGSGGYAGNAGGGGMGGAGMGGGGVGGAGGMGGVGGTAGSPPIGCENNARGIGILSAKLEGERTRLTEGVELNGTPRHIDGIQRLTSSFITLGYGGFWEIELGGSGRKLYVEHDEGSMLGGVPCDLDGDGDEDIVGVGERTLPATSEARVSLWERDGDALVPHHGFAVTVYHPAALAAGDVDGDGDLDIASIDWMGPLVMRNDGGFGFTRMAGSASLGECSHCEVRGVLLDDRDGDGALDLVGVLDSYTNGSEGTWVSIQLGDGDGRFRAPEMVQIADASHLGNATIKADVNGDARIDLVLSTVFDSAPLVHVALGAADGTFLPAERVEQPFSDVLDMDGDGRLDRVGIEDGAAVVRYGRGIDGFEEQRFELAVGGGMEAVFEAARAGEPPKMHTLYQNCQEPCAASCGACVFGSCTECLNHEDCASGVCRYSRCDALPDDDAGIE